MSHHIDESGTKPASITGNSSIIEHYQWLRGLKIDGLIGVETLPDVVRMMKETLPLYYGGDPTGSFY